MAEYNPSKIIKDGNTYNFRDTTKIPLAGSNEISGSLIPSTDGTVNLGGPSYQWKDVNTVLLNGKVPAYNADVVHVKGSDDIIDSKTFISLYTQSSGPSLWMKNTSFTMGTAPATNRYSGIWIQDNAGGDTAYIVHQANKNNSQNLKFSVSNTDGTTVYQNALTFQGRLDGTFNFYSDNPANLGTSTNKWKSFNGINPGALSLPSISSSGANAWIALDTTNWVKNAATSAAQKYTPPADGWLNIRVNNATMLGLALTGGGNYMHQMVRSETPNGLALLIPVFKNIEVAILVAGNENLAYNRSTFYYCQGNI